MDSKESSERKIPPFTMRVFRHRVESVLAIAGEIDETRDLDDARIKEALDLIETLKGDVQSYGVNFGKGRSIDKMNLFGKKELFTLEKHFRHLLIVLMQQAHKKVAVLMKPSKNKVKKEGWPLKNRPGHVAKKKMADRVKRKGKRPGKIQKNRKEKNGSRSRPVGCPKGKML